MVYAASPIFEIPPEIFDLIMETTAAGSPTDAAMVHLSVREARKALKSLAGGLATNKLFRSSLLHYFYASHTFYFESASHARPTITKGEAAAHRLNIIHPPRMSFLVAPSLEMKVLPTFVMQRIQHVKMHLEWHIWEDYLYPFAGLNVFGIDKLDSMRVVMVRVPDVLKNAEGRKMFEFKVVVARSRAKIKVKDLRVRIG